MKKTKLAARSLCAAMLLSSCGTPCGQGDARPPGGDLHSGYEAGADGRNGPVKVSVTFTAEAIEKVEIVEHTETAGIADPAIADIPGENAAKK